MYFLNLQKAFYNPQSMLMVNVGNSTQYKCDSSEIEFPHSTHNTVQSTNCEMSGKYRNIN